MVGHSDTGGFTALLLKEGTMSRVATVRPGSGTGSGCVKTLRRLRKRIWFATCTACEATEWPWQRMQILLTCHANLRLKAESAFRHAATQGAPVNLVTLGACRTIDEFYLKLSAKVTGRPGAVCDRVAAIEFELDLQNHLLKKERTGF